MMADSKPRDLSTDFAVKVIKMCDGNDAWLRHILWQTSHRRETKWSSIILATFTGKGERICYCAKSTLFLV